MTIYECTTSQGNTVRGTDSETMRILGMTHNYVVGAGIFSEGDSNCRPIESEGSYNPFKAESEVKIESPGQQTLDNAVGL